MILIIIFIMLKLDTLKLCFDDIFSAIINYDDISICIPKFINDMYILYDKIDNETRYTKKLRISKEYYLN